jgi:hypothetical protein
MSYAFSFAFEDAFDSPFAVPTDPGQIPPDSILGPIEARIPDIVARVAQNLNAAPEDEWVQTAVESAIIYVTDYTNRNALGLPNDSLTVSGLVVFGTRIHQDAFAPNGAQVAVGDSSFEPIFQPEHLYKHVRHYFNRLDVTWGVA